MPRLPRLWRKTSHQLPDRGFRQRRQTANGQSRRRFDPRHCRSALSQQESTSTGHGRPRRSGLHARGVKGRTGLRASRHKASPNHGLHHARPHRGRKRFGRPKAPREHLALTAWQATNLAHHRPGLSSHRGLSRPRANGKRGAHRKNRTSSLIVRLQARSLSYFMAISAAIVSMPSQRF